MTPFLRAAFAIALAVVGCSRVPPEPSTTTGPSHDVNPPSPPPPSTSSSSDGGIALAGRCVKDTPELAPPEVKAVPEDDECPGIGEVPALRKAPFVVETPEGRCGGRAAATPRETERGLMYRRAMPPMQGMFFSLGGRRVQTFWMRNTCIPLDMLFVDQDGLIVGILENVPPMNDEPRSVGCPSPYVLEMNAGWSRRHGVRAGQKVRLPAL